MLRISPGERFEILVDVADGNAVALMGGPDAGLRLVQRADGPGIDTGDQLVMRIEPSEMPGPIRNVPATLICPDGANIERTLLYSESGSGLVFANNTLAAASNRAARFVERLATREMSQLGRRTTFRRETAAGR
jgi:FtsP/CotA-like multicopper oxidase with cupredoxin domain